jgi:DNA-binding MarR family transcriptional regulator
LTRRRSLTAAGRKALQGASRAADEAEAAFLAPLGDAERDQLRTMLQALIADDQALDKRS